MQRPPSFQFQFFAQPRASASTSGDSQADGGTAVPKPRGGGGGGASLSPGDEAAPTDELSCLGGAGGGLRNASTTMHRRSNPDLLLQHDPRGGTSGGSLVVVPQLATLCIPRMQLLGGGAASSRGMLADSPNVPANNVVGGQGQHLQQRDSLIPNFGLGSSPAVQPLKTLQQPGAGCSSLLSPGRRILGPSSGGGEDAGSNASSNATLVLAPQDHHPRSSASCSKGMTTTSTGPASGATSNYKNQGAANFNSSASGALTSSSTSTVPALMNNDNMRSTRTTTTSSCVTASIATSRGSKTPASTSCRTPTASAEDVEDGEELIVDASTAVPQKLTGGSSECGMGSSQSRVPIQNQALDRHPFSPEPKPAGGQQGQAKNMIDFDSSSCVSSSASSSFSSRPLQVQRAQASSSFSKAVKRASQLDHHVGGGAGGSSSSSMLRFFSNKGTPTTASTPSTSSSSTVSLGPTTCAGGQPRGGGGQQKIQLGQNNAPFLLGVRCISPAPARGPRTMTPCIASTRGFSLDPRGRASERVGGRSSSRQHHQGPRGWSVERPAISSIPSSVAAGAGMITPGCSSSSASSVSTAIGRDADATTASSAFSGAGGSKSVKLKNNAYFFRAGGGGATPSGATGGDGVSSTPTCSALGVGFLGSRLGGASTASTLLSSSGGESGGVTTGSGSASGSTSSSSSTARKINYNNTKKMTSTSRTSFGGSPSDLPPETPKQTGIGGTDIKLLVDGASPLIFASPVAFGEPGSQLAGGCSSRRANSVSERLVSSRSSPLQQLGGPFLEVGDAFEMREQANNGGDPADGRCEFLDGREHQQGSSQAGLRTSWAMKFNRLGINSNAATGHSSKESTAAPVSSVSSSPSYYRASGTSTALSPSCVVESTSCSSSKGSCRGDIRDLQHGYSGHAADVPDELDERLRDEEPVRPAFDQHVRRSQRSSGRASARDAATPDRASRSTHDKSGSGKSKKVTKKSKHKKDHLGSGRTSDAKTDTDSLSGVVSAAGAGAGGGISAMKDTLPNSTCTDFPRRPPPMDRKPGAPLVDASQQGMSSASTSSFSGRKVDNRRAGRPGSGSAHDLDISSRSNKWIPTSVNDHRNTTSETSRTTSRRRRSMEELSHKMFSTEAPAALQDVMRTLDANVKARFQQILSSHSLNDTTSFEGVDFFDFGSNYNSSMRKTGPHRENHKHDADVAEGAAAVTDDVFLRNYFVQSHRFQMHLCSLLDSKLNELAQLQACIARSEHDGTKAASSCRIRTTSKHPPVLNASSQGGGALDRRADILQPGTEANKRLDGASRGSQQAGGKIFLDDLRRKRQGSPSCVTTAATRVSTTGESCQGHQMKDGSISSQNFLERTSTSPTSSSCSTSACGSSFASATGTCSASSASASRTDLTAPGRPRPETTGSASSRPSASSTKTRGKPPTRRPGEPAKAGPQAQPAPRSRVAAAARLFGGQVKPPPSSPVLEHDANDSPLSPMSSAFLFERGESDPTRPLQKEHEDENGAKDEQGQDQEYRHDPLTPPAVPPGRIRVATKAKWVPIEQLTREDLENSRDNVARDLLRSAPSTPHSTPSLTPDFSRDDIIMDQHNQNHSHLHHGGAAKRAGGAVSSLSSKPLGPGPGPPDRVGGRGSGATGTATTSSNFAARTGEGHGHGARVPTNNINRRNYNYNRLKNRTTGGAPGCNNISSSSFSASLMDGTDPCASSMTNFADINNINSEDKVNLNTNTGSQQKGHQGRGVPMLPSSIRTEDMSEKDLLDLTQPLPSPKRYSPPPRRKSLRPTLRQLENESSAGGADCLCPQEFPSGHSEDESSENERRPAWPGDAEDAMKANSASESDHHVQDVQNQEDLNQGRFCSSGITTTGSRMGGTLDEQVDQFHETDTTQGQASSITDRTKSLQQQVELEATKANMLMSTHDQENEALGAMGEPCEMERGNIPAPGELSIAVRDTMLYMLEEQELQGYRVKLTVPENVTPGTLLRFEFGGRSHEVTAPPDAQAGEEILYRVPKRPALEKNAAYAAVRQRYGCTSSTGGQGGGSGGENGNGVESANLGEDQHGGPLHCVIPDRRNVCDQVRMPANFHRETHCRAFSALVAHRNRLQDERASLSPRMNINERRSISSNPWNMLTKKTLDNRMQVGAGKKRWSLLLKGGAPSQAVPGSGCIRGAPATSSLAPFYKNFAATSTTSAAAEEELPHQELQHQEFLDDLLDAQFLLDPPDKDAIAAAENLLQDPLFLQRQDLYKWLRGRNMDPLLPFTPEETEDQVLAEEAEN
ncbi:unnamed protein product [Amoebophrya sp. A25]|nr:unnamed protein product [Amoebophrya sp. A25]|eukprot:GSA25T00000217001.1